MKRFTEDELHRLASVAKGLIIKDHSDVCNKSLRELVELTDTYYELQNRFDRLNRKHRLLKQQLHHTNARMHEIKKGFVTLVSNATKGKGADLAKQVLYNTANALQYLKDQLSVKQNKEFRSQMEVVSQDRYKKDSKTYLNKFKGVPTEQRQVIEIENEEEDASWLFSSPYSSLF